MLQLELSPAFSASLGGRVLPNAHAAGDLDADGRTELVLGSVAGVLLVCKLAPDELVLWRSCTLDGAVTAVCVDDREAAALRVVVATSEGKCFVFRSLETKEAFAPAAEFVRVLPLVSSLCGHSRSQMLLVAPESGAQRQRGRGGRPGARRGHARRPHPGLRLGRQRGANTSVL
jgi:hypothetical protein